MVVGAVILARMSSRRLPGKVLRPLAGQPLLEQVVVRARRIGAVDDFVVATSRDSADDAIERHCDRLGVPVHRGWLDNVARRVLDCARARGWEYFARINADSPFLDPLLVQTGVRRALKDRLDFVTNLRPRSYPYGIAVEVFSTDAFARAYGRMSRADDFEHVSPFFYRHLDEHRYVNLACPHGDCTDVRLTVDDPADLDRAERVIERLGDGWSRAELCDVIAAAREIALPALAHPAVSAGSTRAGDDVCPALSEA